MSTKLSGLCPSITGPSGGVLTRYLLGLTSTRSSGLRLGRRSTLAKSILFGSVMSSDVRLCTVPYPSAKAADLHSTINKL